MSSTMSESLTDLSTTKEQSYSISPPSGDLLTSTLNKHVPTEIANIIIDYKSQAEHHDKIWVVNNTIRWLRSLHMVGWDDLIDINVFYYLPVSQSNWSLQY